MTATYDCIATNTISGAATASVTFSSISGNYTDLVLIINGGIDTSAGNIHIRFNGDTNNNYVTTSLAGGGSFYSSRATAASSAILNDYGYPENDMNCNIIVDIMNYSSTATRKTFISRSNHADNGVAVVSGIWRDTSAITSIEILTIFNPSPKFSIGTTFALYGIKCE